MSFPCAAGRQLNCDEIDFADDSTTALNTPKRDKCFKIRLLLPHILLLSFTILYICTVAIVYYHVEGNNEKMERVKLELALETVQRNLMEVMHSLAPDIPIDILQQETTEFSREMIRLGWTRGRLGVPLAAGANGWTGTAHNDTPATGPIWSPANSLLFAMSVVSKIGYGHIVPMTSLGKLMLFPVVMFGTALFLLTVADFGKFFVEFVIWLYRICWRSYQRLKQRIQKKQPDNEAEEKEEEILIPSSLHILLLLLPLWALLTLLYSHLEGWAWLDCFYFVSVTFTGVGFGDFAPSSTLSILTTIFLIIPVFGFIMMLVDLAGIEIIEKLHYIVRILRRDPDYCAILRRKREIEQEMNVHKNFIK